MANERILVVDDEEDLCEILQFNLEQAGYLVDVAYSAEEVLKQGTEFPESESFSDRYRRSTGCPYAGPQ